MEIAIPQGWTISQPFAPATDATSDLQDFRGMGDQNVASSAWSISQQEVIDEIFSEQDRAKEDNWEGGREKAISNEARLVAIQFIKSLPWGCRLPNVAAMPNGKIGFDWQDENGDVLFASLSENGMLAYALNVGDETKDHGIRGFKGHGVPDFEALLNKYFGS